MTDILLVAILVLGTVNTIRHWKPKQTYLWHNQTWTGSSPTNYFEIGTQEPDYTGGTNIPPCQSPDDDDD